MHKRQESFKEAQESADRERANLAEKCRQSLLKVTGFAKNLKDLTEEVNIRANDATHFVLLAIILIIFA